MATFFDMKGNEIGEDRFVANVTYLDSKGFVTTPDPKFIPSDLRTGGDDFYFLDVLAGGIMGVGLRGTKPYQLCFYSGLTTKDLVVVIEHFSPQYVMSFFQKEDSSPT